MRSLVAQSPRVTSDMVEILLIPEPIDKMEVAKNGAIAFTAAATVGGFIDSFFPTETAVTEANYLKVLTEIIVQAGVTAMAAASVSDFMFRRFGERSDGASTFAAMSGFIHSQRNLARRTNGMAAFLKDKASRTGLSLSGILTPTGPGTTELTASKVIRTPQPDPSQRF
ncbi:hypothetical protein PROFUN_05387 [Planoprotostelium fungivorum]|uniref:Uncharacterized protein n=1 Tax=Planoprotostelium fungivorum TaxID=1890364 RepID=A0A2P6NQK4_9EUKA|nr:hypothetical protein PROFUN_05387 [Planoprotostelium fungivorum]